VRFIDNSTNPIVIIQDFLRYFFHYKKRSFYLDFQRKAKKQAIILCTCVKKADQGIPFKSRQILHQSMKNISFTLINAFWDKNAIIQVI
jgi:hypothetical protein